MQQVAQPAAPIPPPPPPLLSAGQLLVGVADAKRWHLGVTVVTFIITAAARSAMALAHGFAAHLLLIIASEVGGWVGGRSKV